MRLFTILPEERARYEAFAEQTLADDREHPPKPKLRCRLFGHKWFSHVLVPHPYTQWRTICDRCKINQDVAEGRVPKLAPPDVDCHTLPNGECITPDCRLHG